MAYRITTMILSLLGIGTAIFVLFLSLYALVKQKRYIVLAYTAASLLYAAAMVHNLQRYAGLYTCFRQPAALIAGSAALLLLHGYFIWDMFHLLKGKTDGVTECPAEKR